MKEKSTLWVQIRFDILDNTYSLRLTSPGWFNVVSITKDEAEKTSRNHDIKIITINESALPTSFLSSDLGKYYKK